MADFFRLIARAVAALAVVLCLPAFAQDGGLIVRYGVDALAPAVHATREAACQAAFSVWEKDVSYIADRYFKVINSQPPVCRLGGILAGDPYRTDSFFITAETCPDGSKPVDGKCKTPEPDPCPTGQVRDASGNCVPVGGGTDDARCESAALMHNHVGADRIGRVRGRLSLGEEVQTCLDSGTKGASGQPLGCLHKFTTDVQFETPSGWVSEGESWAVTSTAAGNGKGLACALGLDKPADDTKPDQTSPPKTCRNGYTGSVNGVDVCIDRASGQQTGVDWARVTDGDGKQVDLKTEVSCVGDRCTVTQTKTPVGGGESSQTVANIDRTQWCRNNPRHPVCGVPTGSATNGSGGTSGSGSGGGSSGGGSGGGGGCTGPNCGEEKSSFGGSCGAWTCEGDAIMCAVAKEQHRRSCEFFERPASGSPELSAYDEAVKLKGKVTGALEGNREVDVSSAISTVDKFLGGSPGACPADTVINLPLHGSFTISWTPLCPLLSLLGNVLVVLAAIGAAFIVLKRG